MEKSMTVVKRTLEEKIERLEFSMGYLEKDKAASYTRMHAAISEYINVAQKCAELEDELEECNLALKVLYNA